MLRRAELARVLIASPRLLLLDEAHAGLDRASAGLVEVVVDAVRARGGGTVVVSHEPDRLAGTVDRIFEIENGLLRSIDRSTPDVNEVRR
jgi:ABC-type transporter Mla maintaining outer membrane lipid asymmetry ATPase subunit MlaF